MKSFSVIFSVFFFFIQQVVALENYIQFDLNIVKGPESIAFDCKGEGPYTGVSDGRIFKWDGLKYCWEEFAVTSLFRNRELCDGNIDPNLELICGRPLGLKFNTKTCDLYIADAYFGLLVVGPQGGVAKRLAISAKGKPFKFMNGLDIDSNTGIVYFTDSSTIFQRRDVDFLVNTTSDKTGRLLRYNPKTKKVHLLHRGLTFPNGVALSADNSFVLVAESSRRRILKFNLEATAKNSAPKVFANLTNIPDNIKRNGKGEFWVSMGVKLSEDGKVLQDLNKNRDASADGEENFTISEINEFEDKLYIGSVTNSYVRIVNVV